jgi:pimeloyl-ACP methyl ester carboxylesterase
MVVMRRWHSLTVLVLLDFLLIVSSYGVGQRASIAQKNWDFQGHLIGYEVANEQLLEKVNKKEPVLLLNGFGVGSFHQHRLILELVDRDGDRVIYGIDYLGQGRSWPVDCHDGNSKNEEGLQYSADVWIEQIISFLEQVVVGDGEDAQKVHLVGNSVGGHLAAIVATRRPDLVATISLLNATPVWGLNLPFWSGELPPPAIPRIIGRYLFDRIRNPNTIEKYLETAYASRDAFGEELKLQIIGCTEGKCGHAAFTSILWSPPATTANCKNFYDVLAKLQCDVLLVFGEDDPWCKPAFAKRMIQSLADRPSGGCCRYVQLSNVGHCPNHEAPQAVGKAVSAWIGTSDRQSVELVSGGKEAFHEKWGDMEATELSADEIKASFVDKLAVKFV